MVAVALPAVLTGALMKRSSERPSLSLNGNHLVATIDGIGLTPRAYDYFLADARSNVIAEIGRPAREVVKARALDAATEYYALVAKATELGLSTPSDEPLFGSNMAQRKANDLPYGPRVLSERMVIARYVEALEAGIRKRMFPEGSLTEDETKAFWSSAPDLRTIRYGVVVRKIYRGYEASNKEDQRRVMERSLRAVRAGADFAQIALRYSEPFRENGWVHVDERGRQLILRRAVEDAFLRKTFLDMQPGEVRVADSGKGFYMVKCASVDERTRTFAEAKPMIVELLRDQKMKRLVETLKATARVELNEAAYRGIVVN
jgi:hypothetical protein